MKLWKRSVTLQLPLWSILATAIVLLTLMGGLILSQTNLRENWVLRTLDPKNISSADIYFCEFTKIQQEELSAEDIAAVTKIVNEIRLLGKPYQLTPIGGSPRTYIFTLRDGTTFRIGCQLIDEYFYCFNEDYYICDKEDEEARSVFRQLEQLHQQHCEIYFD